MKQILCLALFSLFSLPALAADDEPVRYYDVELIIFENLDPAHRNSENWPTSVERGLPESEVMIELNRPYPGPIPENYNPAYTFKALPRDQYRLTEEIEKIEETPSRRVLMHTAWRQPGMSGEEALNVHLSRTVSAGPGKQSKLDTEQGDNAASKFEGEAGELEAYIKVILSRYLHVDANVIFQTRPQTGRFDFFIEESEEPVVYQLKQLRNRIRSTELHYLDNPVLGMLIVMHPVETDKL
ncbi:MAG: CsiV family protein [Thiohalophilus sp.]|uniref:CsiV family protein n=1 Tax=Thiohalophilus sp. TaxID=3028392 RepID=UPI00286FFA3F|nr:CsiV family protein [Thiohalophilus sp.]MDR9437748.1 CsiV family protein [Thiohalophilus sp.]